MPSDHRVVEPSPTILELTLPEDARAARVVVFGREGCHLCEEAEAIVHASGARWVHLDVDTDPGWRELFTDDVPVVYVDQKLVARWHLTAEALSEALERGL